LRHSEHATSTLRLGVLPGDGIGPEVVEQGLRVLAAVADATDLQLELRPFPHGADHYLDTGELVSEEVLGQLADVDALYLGAVGDPRVETGVLERGILMAISRRFQMDVSVRPYRLHAPGLSPLRDRQAGDIDLVVVRESAEDLFAIPAGLIHPGTDDEVQVGGVAFSRRMVERVTRYGFELARQRSGHAVVVEHSNAAGSHAIWRTTFERLAPEYPDVEASRLAPDAFAMALVSEPERFDVAITSWMLGGVFSDIAAALVGGLGLSGSCRLSSTGGPSMFEPIHGSAPKYAGQGVASPIGAIHSVELLLRHLGHEQGATLIADALASALSDGSIPSVTARSGLSTSTQGDLVLERIGRAMPWRQKGTGSPARAPTSSAT
jgi:3-isopropylmalate dehydrogenase